MLFRSSFYPVFVGYSEKNLDLVKKHFCADAIKRFSQKLGKDVVQVGSFSSREKADKLKLSLSVHLQGSEVGEPTVVQASSQPATAISIKSMGVAAKLTPQQVSELEKVVGGGNNFKTQDVVVIPTYVPEGFKVAHFAAWKQTLTNSPRFSGGHYEILYEDATGSCFTINGGVTQPIGDPPTKYERIVSLSSPALGDVDIGIIGFDRTRSNSFLGFTKSMNRINRGRNEYLFESPPGSIQTGSGFQPISGCKRIDEKEAIHIVQSLQFLNP